MRIFLSFIAICFFLTASAQRQGLTIYLKVGTGYTGLAGYNGPSVAVQKGISNYHTGIFFGAGYMLNDHLGFFTGIGSTVAIWRHVNYYTGNTRQNYDQQQTFLEIPLTARAITSKYAKTGFFGDLGFKICLLRNVDNHLHRSYDDSYPNVNKTIMTSENFSDFNATTIMAYTYVGLYCAIGKRGTMLFGPEIHYQLSNNFSYANLKGHLASVGFKMGVNVQLTRPHSKS